MNEIQIKIRSSQITLASEEKEYVEEKISALIKLLPYRKERAIADVEVRRTTRHHREGRIFRVTVTLSLNGDVIRAEAEELDVRAAVDAVKSDLQGELKKLKGKLVSVARRKELAAKKDIRIAHSARFWRKGRIREESI